MAISNNINIIVTAVDKATAPLKKMGGQFSGFASSVQDSIAGLIEPLSQLGVGLVGVGGYGLKLAGDLEATRTAFDTMLGSAEASKKLLGELSDFASTTPFEFPEIANAGKSLLAFGFEASKIQENLRMLGDIASGLNIPFGELSDIYGKIRVQGQVYAEDINQLTGRGIPIIQELAKQFGVTDGEVKKLVETGKIGFPQIQTAFQNLTTEGGKFEGMMLKQSETLNGTLSTLRDNINMTLLEIIGINKQGEIATGSLMERSKEMVTTLVESLDKNKEYVKIFGEIIIFVLSQVGRFISEAVIDPLMKLGGAFGWIVAQAQIYLPKLYELYVGAFGSIKNVWENIFESIRNTYIMFFDGMEKYIKNKIQGVLDFANNSLKTIQGVFNAVANAKENIGQGISNVVGGITGARALGGTVSAGKTYLVGEKGPELFTPSTMGSVTTNKQLTGGGGGIVINMGGVVVSNQADENRLVEKIKKELTRSMQLGKIGVL